MGGWGDISLGRVGALVSEGAGYKLQCQLDCFPFVSSQAVSGWGSSPASRRCWFWSLASVPYVCQVSFSKRTGGPGCLRKEKDKGREGAGMQVRASMGSCDSVVCMRLVVLVNMSVEGAGESVAHPADTLLPLLQLLYLECRFASSDIPPALSHTRRSSVPFSQGEIHTSISTVLLFHGGRMLRSRWSSLAGGLSLLLQLPKPCFVFANLPGSDCLSFTNSTVHGNLLPFPVWEMWRAAASSPFISRQSPQSWPWSLPSWAYPTLEPPSRHLVVTPSMRPLGGHVLSRAWGGLSVYRWERGQWLFCLRERSRLLVGPRGAEGRKPTSQLGVQSLKENTYQALGLHILAMRMNVNMVIFSLKFEGWIREHEISAPLFCLRHKP